MQSTRLWKVAEEDGVKRQVVIGLAAVDAVKSST